MSFRLSDMYKNFNARHKLDHTGGNIYGNCNIIGGDITINGAPLVPVGTITSYISTNAPQGWLSCDGSEINKETYSRLYDIIGDTFGTPDNSGNFVLPNLQGRVPLGSGTGTGLTTRTVGETGGEETHTLTTGEIPSHTHSATIDNAGSHTHTITDLGHTHQLNMVDTDDGNFSNQVGQYPSGDANKFNGDDHNITTQTGTTGITINSSGDHTHNITIDNTGGELAHNNMQPYLVLNYIIRY